MIVMVMFVLLFSIYTKAAEPIAQIQDFSVTIKSGISEGSGTIITREMFKTEAKKEKVVVNFILTAGHVVDDLRSVRTFIENGRDKKIVEFKDAAMVREENQNGRRVGESKMDCKVVCYSNSTTGEDLALLMIIKQGYKGVDVSAEFYNHEELISVGTQLWHCGSLLGQMGANSLTNGIMSQIGRVYEGKVYDQLTVVAFPGSSGGGVFVIKDNKPLYMGMIVRGAGENFQLAIPIRRIYKWAESNNLKWVFDPSLESPSLEKLLEMPIEGLAEDNDSKEPASKPANTDKKVIFLDGEHAQEWKNN